MSKLKWRRLTFIFESLDGGHYRIYYHEGCYDLYLFNGELIGIYKQLGNAKRKADEYQAKLLNKSNKRSE